VIYHNVTDLISLASPSDCGGGELDGGGTETARSS
jgi:hypothetical protein